MKKERQSLKTFFSTNKIPTAENFADLVDSGINQSEDGIKKDAGSPVSIQAEGSGEGVQDLLFFFKNFSDPNPSWRVNQNPRFDAKDPATSKAGLNISDANALSRLFIKADDGNVGIGTLSPTQKLSVKGGALVGGMDNVAFGLDDRDGARLGIIKKEGSAAPQICSSRDAPIIFGQTNQADIFTNIAGSTITERMRIDAQGRVGIGTSTPIVPLSFANQLGDKIALWGQAASNYGFGVQGALMQIHTDTSNADIAFGSGSSAVFNETMRIKGNGTVGIGTNNPTFPLTFANVAGDKISLWGQGGNSYGFVIDSFVLAKYLIHARSPLPMPIPSLGNSMPEPSFPMLGMMEPPTTCSLARGTVVPMPTLPTPSSVNEESSHGSLIKYILLSFTCIDHCLWPPSVSRKSICGALLLKRNVPSTDILLSALASVD